MRSVANYNHYSILTGVIFSIALTGCDSDGKGETRSEPDQYILIEVLPDSFMPTSTRDMDMEGGSDQGERIPRGEYGDPCTQDDDCLDRICVSGTNGGICSKICFEECEPFGLAQPAFCRSDSSSGRIEFLCYPKQELLCQPCVSDQQCDGARCIQTSEGSRCGRLCEGETDCPSSFSCIEGSCTPRSGACSCIAENEGATRVCELTNEFGTCFGEERCDLEQGWIGCNATTPEEERCDGIDQNCNGVPDDGVISRSCLIENELGQCSGVTICLGEEGESCYGAEPTEERCDLLDNDCDGEVDEDFTLADGRFGLDDHCGGCGISCVGRIPNATVTRCQSTEGTSRCVALTCEEGYQSLDGETCVPLIEVLCQSCLDNSACASRSPGSLCIQTGDPEIPETFAGICGRDCSPEGLFGEACPQGFTCTAIGEEANGPKQCLPTAGHCLCLNQPEGFSLPCEVNSPVQVGLTCTGRRTCEGDSFGACLLPSDECDGVDNDCDGIIDNAYRAEDGQYRLDPQHCGRCGLDCGTITYTNAVSVCNQAAEIPRCVMECQEGFIDLENGSDDGCECQLIDDEDQPDGVDQNCDGIDGDRSVALFVSKTGSDLGSGSLDEPLLSLREALTRAAVAASGIRDIYVATGVYSENITLINGVSLYGGYSLDFKTRDLSQNPTTLLGQNIEGELAAVTAEDINVQTRMDGFSIYGANANRAGGNSVAVLIINAGASFTFSNNQVYAGNGAPGARGQPGVSGLLGDDGSEGDDAIRVGSVSCNQSTPAGRGGVRSCGGLDVSGGDGGEAHCPITQQANGTTPCTHTNPNACRNSCPDDETCIPFPPPQGLGENGSGVGQALGGSGTYDRWSDSGSCGLCGLVPLLPHLGQPGQDGPDGANGVAGQGCTDGQGALSQTLEWSTPSGTDGANGIHGTGGGGGSAGSGYDVTVTGTNCSDTIGGSGGGAGSGGCAGSFGQGGQGGGGSFGILIAFTGATGDTLPRLLDNTISRGIGGVGGAGGTGGVGGFGGEGASGGIATSSAFCTEPGGRGGNGGDGGHGGGGGGGCGGISVSIYVSGSGDQVNPNAYRQVNLLVPSGRGGLGGAGGASTGNSGTDGSVGSVLDISVVE